MSSVWYVLHIIINLSFYVDLLIVLILTQQQINVTLDQSSFNVIKRITVNNMCNYATPLPFSIALLPINFNINKG